MKTHISDLDQTLRAAAGIADAAVPSLPQSVIAALAADTVETIAWSYDESAKRASTPIDSPEALTGRGRRRVVLATAFGVAVAAAGGAIVAVSAGSAGSNTPVASGGGHETPYTAYPAPDPATKKAAEACAKQLNSERAGTSVDFKTSDALLADRIGQTTFTVLANSTGFGDCLVVNGRALTGDVSQVPAGITWPSANGISLGASDFANVSALDVAAVQFAGLAGPGVSKITVLRSDGVVVTASMNDGL